jgi:hypothetical protein
VEGASGGERIVAGPAGPGTPREPAETRKACQGVARSAHSAWGWGRRGDEGSRRRSSRREPANTGPPRMRRERGGGADAVMKDRDGGPSRAGQWPAAADGVSVGGGADVAMKDRDGAQAVASRQRPARRGCGVSAWGWDRRGDEGPRRCPGRRQRPAPPRMRRERVGGGADAAMKDRDGARASRAGQRSARRGCGVSAGVNFTRDFIRWRAISASPSTPDPCLRRRMGRKMFISW